MNNSNFKTTFVPFLYFCGEVSGYCYRIHSNHQINVLVFSLDGTWYAFLGSLTWTLGLHVTSTSMLIVGSGATIACCFTIFNANTANAKRTVRRVHPIITIANSKDGVNCDMSLVVFGTVVYKLVSMPSVHRWGRIVNLWREKKGY